VNEEPQEGAWLEEPGRERVSIQRNCSIGRSPKNSVVLESPKISRRHAIIHVQNIGEFWLIDLGSVNGTFLNKRRVHQPVRLCDQDAITIGDQVFTFRQPMALSDEYQATLAERTLREIADEPCWLLLADIENFTPLSRSMVSDKLATLIGGWVSSCRDVIEAQQGSIDKYLGDGFLAYWRDDEKAAENLAASIHKLKELQARQEPRFRLALHFGRVAIGGASSIDESLMGTEVNFVFRMEKLAGSLGISLLTSAAAKSKLDDLVQCTPVGSYELKGFEGGYEFFSC
jgi:adenylate cyclase